MEIGRKVRELREGKHLSQEDIQKKTGLFRCYTSRVENGYTVPSVETLEKFTRASGIPLYRFFTDGEVIQAPKLPATAIDEWQIDGKHRHELRLFAKAIKQMDGRNQRLLLNLAQKNGTPPHKNLTGHTAMISAATTRSAKPLKPPSPFQDSHPSAS